MENSGSPPSCPPLPRALYNSGYLIFPLAKHIFRLQTYNLLSPSSTLAFVGPLTKAAPFPLVEAQCRAIVKVFENPASLDPTQEAVDIVTRYETFRSNIGDDLLSISKNWHKFKEHEQFDYRDHLYEFVEGDAGAKVIVQDWEKEMYGKKEVLREVWRGLGKRVSG